MSATAEILAQPLRFGPVELATRLVIPPHTVNFGFPNGIPDGDIEAYFVRRAAGFGLTWVPAAAIDPLGRNEPGIPWLWDDRAVPALARLAAALERAGTVPGIQLIHAGSQTDRALLDGAQPVAPSPVTPPTIYTEIPHELTDGEIAGVIESFAAAAARAVSAGYRAIDLHFAHGYLGHQFLSPISNHRTDAYGGSLDNRMRFHLEVVVAVRDAVGPDVAIEARLNGADFMEGGIVIEDAIRVAQALLDHGADALSISGGMYGSTPFTLLLPFDGMPFLPLAGAIRAATGGIVTAVGNIREPEEAAAAIRDGVADLVGVGRAVIADPDWALKALGRLPRPVRPCLGTMEGCSERIRLFQPITCQVMPEVGRERRAVPTSAPQRVAVVGAGPAGAEAAVYAAEAGDHVLVLEASSRVGGALVWAGVVPGGEGFARLHAFYAAEFGRLGVDVRLNTMATRAALEEFAPDHVVIATGAQPDVPTIEGYTEAPLATDEDVLVGEVEVDGRNVVVVGAGRRALSTALWCHDRGAAVTIVDHDLQRAGWDASALMRRALKQELDKRGIAVVKGPIGRLGATRVVVGDGELSADLVVLSARFVSLREAVSLVPAGVSHSVVGDAKEPRSVMDAIAEAREEIDQLHHRAASGA
jgi:2,4-dienoyl-CoA reductase (NADPH2)